MTAHSGLLLLGKFLLRSNQILLRASLLPFQQTTLEEAIRGQASLNPIAKNPYVTSHGSKEREHTFIPSFLRIQPWTWASLPFQEAHARSFPSQEEPRHRMGEEHPQPKNGLQAHSFKYSE